MKILKLLAVASVTGVVLAGSMTATTYAWHPEVKITKYVTNMTASGQMADANTAADAVNTKPGDVIKYTIVIENPAPAAGNAYNDLYFTKMTDTLPAGVALVSDPAQTKISEDLGILKPGDKVTKEYTLKVTSTKDGDVISNEACVTGDSKVKDSPEKDCDTAVIKVKVPPTPELPKETPKVLPITGPADVVVGAGAVTILGYLGNMLRLRFRKEG
jgi:uncharacterized repeat protein (TIGR01451 family)